MLRTQITKLTRATPSLRRSFTVSALQAAEGDTGSTRSGGLRSGDSFNRREAAEETKYVREKEAEALRKLKEKLSQQRKHLDELDDHIREMEGEEPRKK